MATITCGISARIAWNQPLYRRKWKYLSAIGKWLNVLPHKRSLDIASDSMRHDDAKISAVIHALFLMCQSLAVGGLAFSMAIKPVMLRYQVVRVDMIRLAANDSPSNPRFRFRKMYKQ